jgi:hypothetical protein
MQLFQQPFDANTVKPQEAFEPLPAGWYNARIINSEAKPTKDNLSGYLQLDLEVLDGEHKGRKVFDRLNLWNEGSNKEKTREIAQRQLSAYCHATGVFILQDSNQLHGIPLKIKLSIRQSEGFDPTNDVKAVKHIQDGGTPTAAAPDFPSAPAVPFGQNPSLPPQPSPSFAPPAAAPQFAPPPAQTSPAWAGSIAPAAAQPAQQAPWSPPAAPAATGGPVPPWRK